MNILVGKFFKGFVTGGVSGLTLALASGVSVHTLEEGKQVLALLATAFLSGAFHALWNLYFPVQPQS